MDIENTNAGGYMKIKELRNLTGMSQRQFAEYFGISIRTIQEWEQERKSPPSYLVGLLKRILDLEYFKKDEQIKSEGSKYE